MFTSFMMRVFVLLCYLLLSCMAATQWTGMITGTDSAMVAVGAFAGIAHAVFTVWFVKKLFDYLD